MMPPVNTALFDLFQAHGVAAGLHDDGVTLPGGMRARADIVREIPQPTGVTVQLDIAFRFAPGVTIHESFAGVGADRETAVADAFRMFAANSFHVLLAAFLKPEASDEQVTMEEWDIGGESRRVTVGSVGVRGTPASGERLLAWFGKFESLLAAEKMGPEPHWVRLYYAQVNNKTLACEVLRDNESWEEMQAAMAAFPWPTDAAFYSVRRFLVIHGEMSAALTPERAVTLLEEIVAAAPEADDEAIYEALGAAGVPDAIADRAFKFMQIAWGRLLLEKMAITFAPDYYYFDTDGRIVESGMVADDAYFAAATRLSARYIGSPAFQRLALASADVHAVNDLLNGGATPENLFLSPSFLFVAEPTEAGMQNAQRIISEKTAALRAEKLPGSSTTKTEASAAADTPLPAKAPTPWWRFWDR